MKLFVITIFLLFPSIVSAATTGISETKFDVENTQGSISTQKFWVTNTDTIEQTYELKVDESKLSNAISITPNQFRLAPEDAKQVIVRFRQPLESQKAHISLIAFDSNQSSNLKVANGIKIPVQFATKKVAGAMSTNIIKKQDSSTSSIGLFHILVYTIDGILLGLVALYFSRKRLKYNH